MKSEIDDKPSKYMPSEYKPTNYKAELKRVLVVISPHLIAPGAPKESALVARAMALAKATGCQLEFFHVCQNESLASGFFANDDDVRREQEKRVDEDATLMAELVLRLSTEGVKISHDTRWDSSRTNAILRKVNDSQVDLVMKQSAEHVYVMGLLRNTDWDLIRQSPAHVWFVTNQDIDNIDRLVTAVGASTNDAEFFTAADYDVFNMANLIAEGFKAENTPVHAYQVPIGLMTYATYAPDFGNVAYPAASGTPTPEEMRQQLARKHGRSIEAFAEYFNTEPTRVQVSEGHPNDVLAAAALDVKANLIVMAARNLSRWERWSQALTAEPLLANSPCDILFVKDARDPANPDLEKAVMDPAGVFSSPETLAQASEISVLLRNRILEIWKQDIRAQMAEENEGGPTRPTEADRLMAINNAQILLQAEAGSLIKATSH